MTQNVGFIDQGLRIAIGFVLVFLAGTGTIGWWGYVVGVIAMLTGAFRYCPAYGLVGMNTCPTKGKGP